ncbi:MAG TPA: arsenate reductase (glutaredoxin) [Coxiellaceae bacterium]|nr:arsenate reductase (glutaredoxin) [Coxiellaceae bacterium]
MPKVTIYHNPRCSKSREALQLLQSHGIEPNIRLYLENPPTPAELSELLKKLSIKARELIRTKETLYRELKLDKLNCSEADLIKLLCKNPILIERPIVINQKKAVIARPPEKLAEII